MRLNFSIFYQYLLISQFITSVSQELDDTLSPCILSTAWWLKSRNFSKIPFPILSSQHNELILLALEKVTTKNAESKQIINEAYDNPTGTFSKIYDVLRKNLEFEQVILFFFFFFMVLINLGLLKLNKLIST